VTSQTSSSVVPGPIRAISGSARWIIGLLLVLGLVSIVWAAVHFSIYSTASAFVATHSPLLLVLDYAQSTVMTLGYPGLIGIIFLENVFPPIPSDVVLPLAGYTAATTPMSFIGALLATTAGSLLGAIALYGFGAWLGEDRVRRLARRYGRYLTFEEAELDRSLAWFRRHGSIVVMVARVVPVFRSLISIPAGMSGMPIGRFLVFSAIGAAAWNSSLISGGYLLGANWEQVVGWLEQYQMIMIAVNVSAFLVVATLRVRSYRRRQTLTEDSGS
jgi:membrane protein DedA with SNARE-associated domain